jgi:O-antigen ligase
MESLLTKPDERPGEWLLVGVVSTAIAAGIVLAVSFGLGPGIAAAVSILAWLYFSARDIMLGLAIFLVARSSLDLTTDFRLPLPGALSYLNPAGLIAVLFSVVAVGYLWRNRCSIRLVGASCLFTFFLALTFLAVPISGFPVTSFQEWVRVFSPFCAFLIIAIYIRSLPANAVIKSISTGVVIVILSSITPLALGLYQVLTDAGQHHNAEFNRVYGTFPLPNGLAAYIVLIVPILFCALDIWKDLPRRLLLIACIAIAIIVLISTYTRTAWIALAVSFLMLLVTSRRIRPVSLILVLSLVVAGWLLAWPTISARFSDLSGPEASRSSLVGRMYIWDAAVPVFFRNPLVGQGLGMFAMTIGAVGAQNIPGQASASAIAAHNDYLRILVETGIIGFILYFGTLILLFKSAWQLWRCSDDPVASAIGRAFVAVCAGQLAAYAADNLFGMPALQFYFWSLAGIVTGLAQRNTSLAK